MKVNKFNEAISEKTNSVLSGGVFYDLMQYYRHAPMQNQSEVSSAFNDVKDFIDQNFIVKDVEEVKKWLLEQDAKKYNL